MYKEYTLGEIVEEIIDYRGKTPKKLGGDWNDEPTGYRALSAKNIKNGMIVQPETIRYVNEDLYKKWMKQEVEKGMIFITSEAPFGELLYWDSDEKIVLSQRLFGLKIKSDFNSKYIFYYMFGNEFQSELRGRATGSTVTGLRQPELLKCKIMVPDRKVQDYIADTLYNVDKKMQNNNDIINNLYDLSNKIFEKKILLNEKVEKEEFNLSQLCEIANGYSYKGTELNDESNVGMATIKNFERTGGFKVDGFKGVVPEKAKDNHFVELYDILVACTDLTQNADIIGNPIMLLNKSNYEKIIMSMDLVKIIPNEKLIDKYILFSILNSQIFKNYALGYKSGTTVLHLNKNCFSNFKISIPKKELLIDIADCIKNNVLKIGQLIMENSSLEILKQDLIQKLINNEYSL